VDAGHREKWIKLFIYIGLVAGTFAAYEPVRKNGFVNYDDDTYITKNSGVSGGITRDSVILAFKQYHFYMWHPLTTLSHMLDCQLFGLNPLGHHLISLLFHIANAMLLFWILINLTGAIWASAFVAAVFALHPVQVDAVVWAAERKTVLSGFFWFLTIAAYIRYTKKPGTGRYILLFFIYGLCIMTKPVVVTLPFVLLLLDYWPLGRVQYKQDTTIANSNMSTPKERVGQKTSAGWLVIEKIPLFVLSGILSVMTVVAQQSGGVLAATGKISLDYRIANAFISYIKYIGKMIWPSRLAVYYPYDYANLTNTIIAACALVFILITVFSIYVCRRRRYVVVGWLWYVGTLVPVIGLIQAGSQSMANRYMYVPMLGLLIMIAWGIKDLTINRRNIRAVAGILTVVAIISMIILTRIQTGYWKNNFTLFEHTLKVTKNNGIAENNYGCAFLDARQFDEAVLHFNNALRINPANSEARNNLGKALVKLKRPVEAAACFTEILRRNGDSAEIHYRLAVALGMQEKYDEAIKHLTKVLDLEPDYPDAQNKMGFAMLATGKPKEAVGYFNKALRISKDQSDVYVNLGAAYMQLGEYELATRNFTKAVELKSNNINALTNLAWVLATVGDVSAQDANKAIEFAERACKLTEHKKPEPLDTLAAAYAAAGKFPDAVATAEKALDAAKAGGQEDMAVEIQNRLELYRTGRSYHVK
jgi:tetratricopeptide (TPR) repeat protein